MDDVKRYRFKGAAGEYVYANDFDAALAREAALREELADREADVRAHAGRRVAAEQRNAIATEVFSALQDDPRLWIMISSDTAVKINEFLKHKPTESGASDKKCCDRFPKCICGEGADGL